MAQDPIKVAVVQAAPVFMDLASSVEKACGLIAAAALQGATLIVFPEAFLPGYPDWVWTVPAHERKVINEAYRELLQNAVDIPSEATGKLCRAAHEAGAFVTIGVNERNAEASGTTLYNTLLFIDAEGTLVGRHRKLIPTAPERLMWAQGDGSTLQVYDTPMGKLSGLICWENYMPLARYAMYAWGSRIHVAPTWDSGEPWLSTMRHIAKEGRLYVIGCCQAIQTSDIPDRFAFKRFYPPGTKWINSGDSCVVDPEGRIVAGPLHEKEATLFCDLDPGLVAASRWKLDVAGHYARPDVFQLTVVRKAKAMIGEKAVKKVKKAKHVAKPKRIAKPRKGKKRGR